MTTTPTRAERLFARLVRLMPRDFADEYGADAAASFARRSAEARRDRGRARWLAWVLRELAGLARVAVLEHAAVAQRPTTPSDGGPSTMEHLLRESRHAVRRLLRTPGFTAAAVLTLALAVAANTAIFALVYHIAIAPLPYPAAERLIALEHAAPGVGLASGVGMSEGFYREYGRLPSVEAIALYQTGDVTLSGTGDAAERLQALRATPSLGGLLGARPALGRWLGEADGRPGAPNVALLTHALWARRFGASPAVLGTTVRLDGVSYQVVGVMPPAFAFPDDRPALVLPLTLDPAEPRLGGFNFRGIARLRPGASAAAVRRAQDDVIAQLPVRFPASAGLARTLIDAKLGSLAQPFREQVLGETARVLWVLLGAVAVVLLIACANLANLFLVRADARWREVAVRRALGAGAGRLAAFFLAESLLVALASGVLGLLLGGAAVELLVRHGPVALPRLHEVRIGGVVASFALLASVAAGLGLGLMPLARRAPAAASPLLQEAGRGNTVSGGRMRARRTLMAAQVALAVVLLVAAGLMARSVHHLRRVDPGFRADSRLTFRVGLSDADYPSGDAAAAFHDRLLERLRALPGVRDAAYTSMLPLDGDGEGDPLEVRGRPTESGTVNPVVRVRRVSPSYFSTIGIPMRRGRPFDAADAAGRTGSVVVNEALAALYFPGQEVLGRQLRKVGSSESDGWLTVVGVVGNTATYDLREETPTPQLFLPPRSGVNARVGSPHRVAYVLRTTGGTPLELVPAVRRALGELDPGVAMARAEPLSELVARAGARAAFTTVLLLIAAAVALSLGLVGVYAVISYGVAQRTGEIGVRLALGARPADVRAMVVRQSGGVIACGVVLGLAAAVAGTRPLRALLYGVAWNDAPTYAAVAVGIFAVAMAACWMPAARAARVEPMEALR